MDVGVDGLLLVASRAKVDDLDRGGLEAVGGRRTGISECSAPVRSLVTGAKGEVEGDESRAGGGRGKCRKERRVLKLGPSEERRLKRGKRGGRDSPLEKDILGLQIAMNDLGFLEDHQRIQQLRREDPNEAGAEPSERVLLDEFVEVVGEKFEDEAEVRVVDKGVLESEHVVFVRGVPLVVDLWV